MAGVYILSDPNTGFLKIGRARDRDQRIATLRTGNPYLLLEEWFETDHASKLEATLHGVFACKRRKREFFEVDLQEAVAKANMILEIIQSMPTDQDLNALSEMLSLDEERDPNENEIVFMQRLFEIRSQKKLLELEEELLEKKLKISIGHSAGLKNFASFKSVKRTSLDTNSLRNNHPDIYSLFQRESHTRTLRVRPFLEN